MSAKYYIYAGGRWCEVDTRRGRVMGWRARPRFCFMQGGRLHTARSGPVLRGLRALALGASSAVRDAAPLSQRPPRLESKSRRRDACPLTHTHHCSHSRSRRRDACPHTHAHHCIHTRCDVNANELGKPCPAAPHPATRSPAKRRRISSEETKEPLPKSSVKQRQASPRKAQRNHNIVSSSSDVEVQKVVQKPAPRTKALSSQRHINVIIVDKGGAISDAEDKKPHSVKGSPRKRNTVRISDSSSKEEVVKSPVLQKNKRRASKHTRAEKFLDCLLDSSGSEQTATVQALEGNVRCKELVIDESDVKLLRKFLALQGRGSVARFDNDERYKLRVFHRLNPLVTLQRCQPLENLLRQRLTLKEFARNLGLRSVAEVTPEKRYRMRRHARNPRTASESGTDKENVTKPKRRRLWNNDKELFNSVRESQSSELLRKKPRIPKPLARDSSRDTSDSDTEFKRRVREQLESKERDGPPRRPTRSTGATRALKDQNADALRSSNKTEEKESRQTRISIRNNMTTKAKEQSKPSDNANTKPARVKRHDSDAAASTTRRTRSALKQVASPVKSKLVVSETESGDMKLKLARISRSANSSEWEVVSKQAKCSGGDVPTGTLKDRNKPTDSDNALETKRSPKKANVIGQPTRRNEKDSSVGKVTEKDGRRRHEEKSVVRSVTSKPLKVRKCRVAAGREYSSLEDHAIVAWLGGGARRERRVNGNRLWRELALEYPRLTGHSRSWHSLRNRYLRYVLPALGSLALPPAQVSRLRAAAAAGEIKRRGVALRRNSMFSVPAVRSASAALRAHAQGVGGEGEGEGRRRRREEDASPGPRRTRSSRASPLTPHNR